MTMWPFARPRPPSAIPVSEVSVGDLLGALRGRLVRRIKEVNATTERETLAAGGALSHLVDVGRGHAAEVRRVLDHVVSGDGATLTKAVRELAQRMRSDLDRVAGSLQQHCNEVAAASSHAGQIATAAGDIASLASQARTLALNARIEAARVGDHGFAVIAQEMKRLSDAIAATNATINRLAGSLGTELPALRAQSASLGAETSALAGDLRADLSNVERQLELLHEQVRGALDATDHTVTSMLDASHTALSHLQFQDVCAQQLLAVDGWVHEAQTAVTPDGPRAAIAPPVQTTLGAGAGPPVQPAGEVALF
ncbi:MAG: methyl-accepting chemotaxis protein [Myxococcales bacterium]|nr:methyl-accepting chemotaxis protein [Myxococcales bacterium]